MLESKPAVLLLEVSVRTVGRLPWRRLLVRGPSMAPTLRDDDVVIVSVRATPEPGSVVLIRWAFRPGQLSVKRAVCREGDGWRVVGDNPAGSTDSRELGPAEVVGVIVFRLWPRPGRLRSGSR